MPYIYLHGSFEEHYSLPQKEFDNQVIDLRFIKQSSIQRNLELVLKLEPSRHVLRYLSDFKDIHRGALRGQLKDTKTLQYEEKQYRERKGKGYKHFQLNWAQLYRHLNPRINAEDVRAWGVEGLQFKPGFKRQDIPGWELIFQREKQKIYRRRHDGTVSRWSQAGMWFLNDI